MSQARPFLRIASSAEAKPTSSLDAIRDRLRIALEGESRREIGMRTGTHPETVRRYLADGHPSVTFVSKVARVYGISCEWLLLGTGPVRPHDVAEEVLRATPLPGLLRSIAEKLAAADAQAELPLNVTGRLRYAPPASLTPVGHPSSGGSNQSRAT